MKRVTHFKMLKGGSVNSFSTSRAFVYMNSFERLLCICKQWFIPRHTTFQQQVSSYHNGAIVGHTLTFIHSI